MKNLMLKVSISKVPGDKKVCQALYEFHLDRIWHFKGAYDNFPLTDLHCFEGYEFSRMLIKKYAI